MCDVALFYGASSGGIKRFVDEKARFAAASGAFEHHLVVPGPTERHDGRRHAIPGPRVVAANGYRVPLDRGALARTLRLLRPDVVCLHDPYWAVLGAARAARDAGALVVGVHHAGIGLNAGAMPGPPSLWRPAVTAWFRRGAKLVDAVQSVVDPRPDLGRHADLPLRLGIGPAFCPQPGVGRVDEVLYAGRLSREKDVELLLEAVARGSWRLRLVGDGPLRERLRRRSEHADLRGRVAFEAFESDPVALARRFAAARVVVQPGRHETFGLVTLEAAACGTRVVTCDSTPAARLVPEAAETYRAGDARALRAAIGRAWERPAPPRTARAVVERHGWDAALAAELADLRELLRDR